MATKRLAPDVDANCVVGTLYQGGAPSPRESLYKAVNAICFCAWEYQPEPWWGTRVKWIRAILDDSSGRMTRQEQSQAIAAARKVRRLLDKGAVVLVTCYAGLNRSGLVSALALMMPTLQPSQTPGNLTSRQAIHLVRRARGANALSNDQFVLFLESFDSGRSGCRAGW